MVLGKAFRSCKKFITETPIHQLAIMVGIGAATVQSFGYYVRSKSADNITQKEYFLNAIKLTKNHPAAEYLIGKPIYYKHMNLRKAQDNFTQDKDTYLRVPVHGQKGNGSLFLHIICDPSCVLQRAEMGIDETSALSPEKYEGKRLLIYDYDKHGPCDAIQ